MVHILQNSSYVFLAFDDATSELILRSHFFMREISRDELNKQVNDSGEVPNFVNSRNFNNAKVWQRRAA